MELGSDGEILVDRTRDVVKLPVRHLVVQKRAPRTRAQQDRANALALHARHIRTPSQHGADLTRRRKRTAARRGGLTTDQLKEVDESQLPSRALMSQQSTTFQRLKRLDRAGNVIPSKANPLSVRCSSLRFVASTSLSWAISKSESETDACMPAYCKIPIFPLLRSLQLTQHLHDTLQNASDDLPALFSADANHLNIRQVRQIFTDHGHRRPTFDQLLDPAYLDNGLLLTKASILMLLRASSTIIRSQ